MHFVETALTKAANLVRGEDYYRKYERMFRRDLRDIPSLALLGARVRGNVVDLGCGIGYLSRLYPSYVGVDRDARAIGIARSQGVGAVLRGRISRLPFRNGSFDWAIVYDVAEHLPDLASGVAEVKRVATNAAFAIVDFTSYYRWFTHDETHVDHLAPHGLIEILNRHYRLVEPVWTSGIFSAPKFLNRLLARRYPNEVVCFCYA